MVRRMRKMLVDDKVVRYRVDGQSGRLRCCSNANCRLNARLRDRVPACGRPAEGRIHRAATNIVWGTVAKHLNIPRPEFLRRPGAEEG